MSPAEDFIYRFEGPQHHVLRYFHRLLTEEMDLTCTMRFKIPFYDRKSWICYLNPTKDGKVELAFTRGNELSNAQGLLQHRGRKQISGIVFGSLDDIPEQAIREVIHEALMLDDLTPYTSKRMPKA